MDQQHKHEQTRETEKYRERRRKTGRETDVNEWSHDGNWGSMEETS